MLRSSTLFLYAALVVLVLSLIAATFLSRSQVKPLQQVADAAQNFGRGDLSVRVKVSPHNSKEIIDLAQAFNSMADSLEKSEQRRNEFIANVSHELKTPMTTIGGFIDGMADYLVETRRGHYVDYDEVMSTALVLNVIDIIALLLQCTFASINDVLYGILIIIIYTNVMNQVLIMGSSDAQFIVISDKWGDIREALIDDLKAGITLLHGQSGYRGVEQQVIICTVRRRNVKRVKDTILRVDPVAFTTIMPATDVSGRGFSLDRYYGRNDYNDVEEKA